MSNIDKHIDKQALLINAQLASSGKWIKESGDGWEAICSSDDQANSGFIIAHFEGPDAKENREFIQAANPATVLALLDELEAKEEQRANWFQMAEKLGADLDAAERRIAELEVSHGNLREAMAAIHNTITDGGAYTPLAAILNASKRAYEESAAAAGKGE
ncbi:ead/Ea22-like family protein [Enterobacter roggenkampii]|uniref:ead/Ea22-like family protein n=1 Tax=Enterobacter roggenkampii TaxID=1812935 RepID=UPI002006655C|nr:ead/Ea22-like family protein [Enterobacter roggenkampii]MCK7149850.1 ead/Ea22-like family protein [Enterobacter roggenkampii]